MRKGLQDFDSQGKTPDDHITHSVRGHLVLLPCGSKACGDFPWATAFFRLNHTFWFVLFSVLTISSVFSASPGKRIYALITIQDYREACEEARRVLSHFPHSKQVWEAYICALAKSGDEKKMCLAWGEYVQLFPDEVQNRRLLENMAWGIIEKGSQSPSPMIRTYAILGAFFGQDGKGIEVLRATLSDPNANIREITLKLVSNLRDASLQEEVLRLFRKEGNIAVRFEVIKAIGKMKIRAAQPELIAIVGNDRSRAEEKAAAIESLVHLLEIPHRQEICHLAQSRRSGLRQLACQVVIYTQETRDIDQIIPLLTDHCADVRCAAMQVLGLLQIKEWDGQPVSDLILPHLDDPHPHAAITAAWLLTLNDPIQGQKAFEKWLNHQNREIRLVSSAALAATGPYGYPLVKQAFYSAKDPFQKMNLALGLLGQREECRSSCQAIYQCFIVEGERWMWDRKSNFRFIAPSKIKYGDLIHNKPEVINQLTRLEMLNILALMDDPNAQSAIKHFLQNRNWGISGLATVLLLSEGDEGALDHVRNLLYDPDQKIRVQAALVLALWGREESAIHVLQQAYKGADREMKERILERIGHVGAHSSIPFLTEQIKESHQSLRIIAAASLLQCLYH